MDDLTAHMKERAAKLVASDIAYPKMMSRSIANQVQRYYLEWLLFQLAKQKKDHQNTIKNAGVSAPIPRFKLPESLVAPIIKYGEANLYDLEKAVKSGALSKESFRIIDDFLQDPSYQNLKNLPAEDAIWLGSVLEDISADSGLPGKTRVAARNFMRKLGSAKVAGPKNAETQFAKDKIEEINETLIRLKPLFGTLKTVKGPETRVANRVWKEPVDLSDLPYQYDAIKDTSLQDITVIFDVDKRVKQWAGIYSPKTRTLTVQVTPVVRTTAKGIKQIFDHTEETIQHELRHFVQDLLQRKFGSKAGTRYGKREALPERDKTVRHQTASEQDFPGASKQDRYYLTPNEFYPNLETAIFRFLQYYRDLELVPTRADFNVWFAVKPKEREPTSSVPNVSPFFSALKKYDPGRYKVAVKQAWRKASPELGKATARIAAATEDPKKLGKQYLDYLEELKEAVDFADTHGLEGSSTLWLSWINFYHAGYKWGQYVIDKLAIPSSKAKGVELAVRLFQKRYGRGKGPKNGVISWFLKNEKRFNVLKEAVSWPERSEEDGIFKHGPFTVHNTIGASIQDVAEARKIIDMALKAAPKTDLPGFKASATGDIYLVGEIGRKNWAAWYVYRKDAIYLRPKLRGRKTADNAKTLLHEIGHRYWARSLSPEIKRAWERHHDHMKSRSGTAIMPEVGVPVPNAVVNNKKFKVGEYGPDGVVLLNIRDDKRIGVMPNHQFKKFMEELNVLGQFPSSYAATGGPEEHFCEALSYRAMGGLSAENEASYRRVLLGEQESTKVAATKDPALDPERIKKMAEGVHKAEKFHRKKKAEHDRERGIHDKMTLKEREEALYEPILTRKEQGIDVLYIPSKPHIVLVKNRQRYDVFDLKKKEHVAQLKKSEATQWLKKLSDKKVRASASKPLKTMSAQQVVSVLKKADAKGKQAGFNQEARYNLVLEKGEHVLVDVPIRSLDHEYDHDGPTKGQTERIAKYERMSGTPPPIYITFNQRSFKRGKKTAFVADGNHRLQVAKNKGQKTIKAMMPLDDWERFNGVLAGKTKASVPLPKNKWERLTAQDLAKDPDLAAELYGLIKLAYSKIGGHATLTSPRALMNGEVTFFDVIDLDNDPDVDAVSLSKKKPAGEKGVGMGHDGSRTAKDALIKRRAKTLQRRGVFIEVSDAIAHILLTRYTVPVVTDETAVRKVLKGKDIEWVGPHPDGKYPGADGWYVRKIGGHPHMKIMLGKPKA